MNILITGGAGYIGTELVYLLEQEKTIKEIVVYDNLCRKNFNLFIGKSKLPSKKVRLVIGDLLDSRKLKTEVEKADVVFHLAAKVTTPFADRNPHEFDQTNNWGTAELTYLIENSAVSKFIYISSVSVYGGASENELDINSTPNPKTFYGISKWNAEKHVQRLQNSKLDTYILRLGNVYGYSKSMRFDSVINKFMFEANFKNHIRIHGDGNQMRSFIHIDKVSSLLKNLLFSEFKPDTYNLVEKNYSINEIVDVLKQIYPTLEFTYLTQNMNMRSLKVAQDSRIQELCGDKEVGLLEALSKFREEFSF